jgi:hypothetical protein
MSTWRQPENQSLKRFAFDLRRQIKVKRTTRGCSTAFREKLSLGFSTTHLREELAMKPWILAAAMGLAAQTATAQEIVTYTTDQNFGDVAFGLESAILDRGLVIDNVSHVGEMLQRTRADVGSDVVLYKEADTYSFCSAILSREVMEADPMNIAYCPYDIFVAERADTPGEVIVGYRSFPEGEMQKIQELLDGITRAAIGME